MNDINNPSQNDKKLLRNVPKMTIDNIRELFVTDPELADFMLRITSTYTSTLGEAIALTIIKHLTEGTFPVNLDNFLKNLSFVSDEKCKTVKYVELIIKILIDDHNATYANNLVYFEYIDGVREFHED